MQKLAIQPGSFSGSFTASPTNRVDIAKSKFLGLIKKEMKKEMAEQQKEEEK